MNMAPDLYMYMQIYVKFLQTVVNVVAFINSTNFLLYFLQRAKFRGELKALFCCKAASSDIL